VKKSSPIYAALHGGIVKGRKNTDAPTIIKRTGIAVVLAALLAGCTTVPTTAKGWFDKGYSRLEAGDYEGSIAAFDRSIELDPAHAVTYQNRGVCYSRLGDQQAALLDFKKVLSMNDPKVPFRDTYREMGVVYYRMDRIDDAVAAWQKGLKKAPSDPGLLNDIAVAYMQQKQYDKAASAAQEAYKADPSIPEVLNTMGEVSMFKKDYAAAVEYFMRASKGDPKKASHYLNVALALEKTKQYKKALQYATKYSDMVTDDGSREKASDLIERLQNKMDRWSPPDEGGSQE
jgi:tetratricopeptide (TPR) repeat protein